MIEMIDERGIKHGKMDLPEIFSELYDGEVNISAGLASLVAYFFDVDDKELKMKIKKVIIASRELSKVMDEMEDYINKNY